MAPKSGATGSPWTGGRTTWNTMEGLVLFHAAPTRELSRWRDREIPSLYIHGDNQMRHSIADQSTKHMSANRHHSTNILTAYDLSSCNPTNNARLAPRAGEGGSTGMVLNNHTCEKK